MRTSHISPETPNLVLLGVSDKIAPESDQAVDVKFSGETLTHRTCEVMVSAKADLVTKATRTSDLRIFMQAIAWHEPR